MTVKQQEGKKEDGGVGDVELHGVSGGGEATTAAAIAQAQLVPTGHTLLDPQTIAVLSRMDSFFIQQRIRMIEAVTGGCIEQANVYDVFDHATNKRIMIMKEESDGCSRCCCSPDHSVFVKFYHVAASAPELQPGQLVDWSYDPSEEAGGSPFMTFEREGCDCCCKGLCPKPCLCCFACKESCSQVGTLHAGDLAGEPGDAHGKRDRTKLLGETIQPRGGGGFKPVMQMMDRADPTDGATGRSELFAATRGPCFTGGCSKLCCDAEFGSSVAAPTDYGKVKQMHTLNFGDFATITKLKPKTMAQGAREMFTDADLFDVQFKNPSITPQQKATVLAQMIHLDYMFFERDGDMCYSDSAGFHIVFCNCFIYGCVCPCEIVLNGNN